MGPPVKRGGMPAFFNCVPSSSNTSAALTAGPALAGRTVPGYASDAVDRVVVEDGLARMEPRDSGLHTNVLLGTVANAQQQDCTLVDPSGGTLGTAIALAFSALPSVVTWNIPACIAPIVVGVRETGRWMGLIPSRRLRGRGRRRRTWPVIMCSPEY